MIRVGVIGAGAVAPVSCRDFVALNRVFAAPRAPDAVYRAAAAGREVILDGSD